ncbi:MAG: type I pullulanase [Halanaerobiales bacterium]|nr:type I pullulanase [Halanaerobiales bacterium]
MNIIELQEDVFRPEFIYHGNDLGVNYTKENTKILLWAPTAEEIKIEIYNYYKNKDPYEVFDLNKNINGTWKVNLEGDYGGKYYLFKIDFGSKIVKTIDPYAKGLASNSEMGLIVDFEKTNPDDWQKDKRVNIKSPVDAIIYEVHVRDFSSSPYSGMKNSGDYLAFTENNTVNNQGLSTGIDHLKELGITHIHLLPVFDYASVDEEIKYEYNWGYDPHFYNVPEGSYANNSEGYQRISEFKKMIKSLHDNGIGVIMDVVYNHTYFTEQSAFQKTAPGYFYRTVDNCYLTNGSGCGNEIATERPMVRKFIIDSLKYWAKEYHIDGFRFDLMGLMDKETVYNIEKSLHNIDPNILIYGEPWAASPPHLKDYQKIYKGIQRNHKFGFFNDSFRDAIKGDTNGFVTGYVNGKFQTYNDIKRGVVGSIDFNFEVKDFAYKPEETVNYVSSHDNLTLWDKINKSMSKATEIKRIKMDRLAQAIVFTSQGIPFFQGGEEFLRTKYGNHNSYNAGDHINQIKWERKSLYYETFLYYKGLIKLRKKHSAFRMREADMIRNKLEFLQGEDAAIGYMFKDHANNDKWRNIFVIYNPQHHWTRFWLEKKYNFNIVVNETKSGTDILHRFRADNIKVPPITAMVLYTD